MKQLSLFIVLCLLAGAAHGATASGTVTNASTTMPVSGQRIYINDSASTYLDSTLTNASGGYSFTLPSSVTTGHFLSVYGTACGAFFRSGQVYGGVSITASFSVCGSTPPATYTLHGTVTLSGISNNGVTKLYLIRMQPDSTVVTDTTLTAIDSIFTGSTGGTYSKTYSFIPSGTLLLKAALTATHPSYASYLPTYYASSLTWNSATALTASNFVPANATNITMTAGTNPGGPGFIGGSVILGANKGNAVGDPVPNRILLLTNGSNQPVAYTYSDATGKFRFNNLAAGSYKVFGDAWGKTNPVLSLTLTTGQPGISTIIFKENSKTFVGSFSNVGVAPNAKLAGITAYPNPAADYLRISGLSAVGGSKTITLRDVTGAVITRLSATQDEVAVPMAALAAGIYLLNVQTEEGAMSFRVTK